MVATYSKNIRANKSNINDLTSDANFHGVVRPMIGKSTRAMYSAPDLRRRCATYTI